MGAGQEPERRWRPAFYDMIKGLGLMNQFTKDYTQTVKQVSEINCVLEKFKYTVSNLFRSDQKTLVCLMIALRIDS